MRYSLLKSLFVTVAALFPTLAALGQAGFLDPSFGGTGMIQIGFGGANEIGRATAVQPDGLLLVAGIRQDTSQIILVRFGTNNLPDPSFGSGWLVAFTPPQDSQVAGLAVQPDGKIVVAGSALALGSFNNNFMLARFNSDGSLDASFGSGGFVSQDLASSSDDTVSAMVLQSDGKIVLAGDTIVNPGSFNAQYYLSLARFDTNGNLDASFGSSGVVLNSGGGNALALALEGDGNILTCSGSQVLRYTTNGVLDGSFGSGGKVTIPTASQITALALQGPGIQVGQPAMIVAAGTSSGGVLVARLSLSGALDTGFNTVGYVSKSIGTGPRVSAVRPFISGIFSRVVKILVSGDTDGGTNFMVARFNNDGSTDTSFGSSGVALTPIPGDSAQDYALAVLPSSLLVQVGTRSIGANCESDIVVARYVYSSGLLDTNFYGSGVLTTSIGNRLAEANAVSIQHDGKILIAGYCINNCGNYVLALCRLNSDSSLDPSFGSGGKVITDIGPQSSLQTPMVLQPDGKILVAGAAYDGTNNSVIVFRFLTNGAPDVSFGSGGSVLSVTGTSGSSPTSIALQGDGKIVVSAYTSAGGNDIAILRFNSNGSPDTTWNGTGKLLTAIGSSDDAMAAMAIQSDGKIIDSGASAFSSVARFSMLRCATNGTLDNSFGSFGKVATQIPNETVSASYAMTLQPDHKIILGGVVAKTPDLQLQMAVARYNTNGTLDATFGSGGATITSIGLGNSQVNGVALQSDGKIVAACRAQNGPYFTFAAARFLANGALDPNYGFGGVNYFDYGTGADETVNAMALDSLGRMVMVGRAGDLFAIVRVSGDPTLLFTSISRLANQHILLTGSGYPSASHTLLKATNAGGPFTFFAPLTTDPDGNWFYEDTTGSGSAIGFYRFSYP
jgi:uncharacterized delta-60 repeat protein